MVYLNSSWVQRQIAMHTSGSTSPHVNVGDVRAFTIPVPPWRLWQTFSENCAQLLESTAAAEARLLKAQEQAIAICENVLVGESN